MQEREGGTLGVRRVAPGEQDTLLGHAIEAWSLHPFAAVGAHVGIGRIVGNAEEDIRAGRFAGRC